MFIFSHLHQLFKRRSVSILHPYVAGGKNGPLQCPRCQGHNVGPWGTYHYQPGLKRYRCKELVWEPTFNDLTETLLDQCECSVMHWMLATFLLCLSVFLSPIAREVGARGGRAIAGVGGCATRPWSYQDGSGTWLGTVEADDLYQTSAGHKGQAKQGGKKSWGRTPTAGAARNASPGVATTTRIGPLIIAWISRQGGVVIHVTRDFTVKTVQQGQRTALYARQSGSTPTRPAVIARSRAMCTTLSITPRRNMPVGTCMRIGRSASFRCSSPIGWCSKDQQDQPARECGLLSVLAQISSSDGV